MTTQSAAGSDSQKKILTDRLLKAVKPAQAGQRYVIWDATVPGFGVRVTDRPNAKGRAASISFIVMRRLPGQKQPIRHTIGRYHPDHPEVLPLAKARDEARRVLGLILGGTSPKEEKRRREEEQRRHQEEQQRREREEAERLANTVGAVAEEFIKDMKRRGLRNAGEFEAIIRRELLPKWRDRPIGEITRRDAAKLIRDIMTRGGEPDPGRRRRVSGGPWAAHHAFAIAKTMFGWALDQDEIDLAASPFDSLKPKKLIGAKEPRQRTLDESEIRAVWTAVERFGGPYGDLVRLLLLTAQRLSQTATMQRAEPDLDKALWNSPAAKMKMKKPHVTVACACRRRSAAGEAETADPSPRLPILDYPRRATDQWLQQVQAATRLPRRRDPPRGSGRRRD